MLSFLCIPQEVPAGLSLPAATLGQKAMLFISSHSMQNKTLIRLDIAILLHVSFRGFSLKITLDTGWPKIF